jgi:hypothetical protein
MKVWWFWGLRRADRDAAVTCIPRNSRVMPPNLKLQFDGDQPFQLAAVQAIVDLSDEQPYS